MALPALTRNETPFLETDQVVKRPTLQAQKFIKPSLSKIPRRIRRLAIPAQAVGGSTGITLVTVPAGSIWRWIGGIVAYQASATVGARSIRLQWRAPGATGIFAPFMRSNLAAPTAGQLSLLESAYNITTFTAISIGGNADSESPAPASPLPEGCSLFVHDNSNIDPADTAQLEAIVEEFSLPRGLAAGEIPMGLESGFMWDLAESRKVSED